MKLDVKFQEIEQRIETKYKEVNDVSDGGYERGYNEGYEEGNEQGYTNGYRQGVDDSALELWNNNSAVMSDYWLFNSSLGAYPYRNMGLQTGKYKFTVKEHYCNSDTKPTDLTGAYCLYISTKPAGPSGALIGNTGTTSKLKEYEFTVKEGETWYFNIYPPNKQNDLFNRLLIGASLKRIGNAE